MITLEFLEKKKEELLKQLENLKNNHIATEGALQIINHLIQEEVKQLALLEKEVENASQSNS